MRVLAQSVLIAIAAVVAKLFLEVGCFLILRYVLAGLLSGYQFKPDSVEIFLVMVGIFGLTPIFLVYSVCGCFINLKIQKKDILKAYVLVWLVTLAFLHFFTPYVLFFLEPEHHLSTFFNLIYYFVPLAGLITGGAFCARYRSAALQA